jgi:GT2 family glycosyltransferase
MKYRFESTFLNDNILYLQGFLIGNNPDSHGTYSLMNKNKEIVPFSIKEIVRNDVGDRFFGRIVENHYGFSISFSYHSGENYDLQMSMNQKIMHVTINDFFLWRTNKWNEFKNNASVQNVVFKLRNMGKGKLTYPSWYRQHALSKHVLIKQTNRIWPQNAPQFSIVIPLYNTPEKFLRELLHSLKNQSYSRFEVCFADGSKKNDLKNIIESCHDKRFIYNHLEQNGGISDNTNAAISLSTGDYIVLCDHDDLLTPNALYEFADAITKDKTIDVLYSDEDKIDQSGMLFQPHFKPDYDPDLLASNNYICHLFAVQRTLVSKFGVFNSTYDGAQDHDFIMRMCENAVNIKHISKVLYHWRSHSGSTSSNANAKLYAFASGEKVIEEHYHRMYPQYPVEKVTVGASYGIYHTYFQITDEPLISIIIPNKDHLSDLKNAITSLEEKNTWHNYEIIIVENNSTNSEIFQYYSRCTSTYSNVSVLHYNGEFNYSAINNYAAKYAKGDYLFFLNNDTELIEKDSIKEMYSYARRDDVGAVGCRLLYPDQTIQHAGVVIGIGVADHIFKGQLSENGQTYFNRALTVQNYSAVTAAAMMMKKSVFNEVGGFDEKLAVAFNDIDLCLKIRKTGRLIVYNPYACFYHYESKTRGKDNNAEKKNRYMSELELFNSRWESFLKDGDPYYNSNFSLQTTDCSLRDE